MSNKRIGGDFNSLFDDNNMEESEGLRTLRLSEIEPNKGQPRKVFDKEAMEQADHFICYLPLYICLTGIGGDGF